MPKLPRLKFETFETDGSPAGQFVWGSSRHNLQERFWAADDIEEIDGYVDELIDIIKEDRYFLDAYDALGQIELEEGNFGRALLHFQTAYELGRSVIPNKFDGRIEWGFLENRPFLRVMHGLGTAYLALHEWEPASHIFEMMLYYNPNDNTGARSLAVQSYIARGKFEEIIHLAKRYPEDILVDIPYGLVLAYFYLGRTKEAEKALKYAIENCAHVARELIKTRHKPIPSKIPGTITVGGEDEAYEYWERVGHYWTYPPLLRFVQEGLKEWHRLSPGKKSEKAAGRRRKGS